ncbi:MAG: transporter substrate-binding domain-containing protein [Lachnospiraceae bacterium]|nr:transporter substrate-binding domain-containing protein [Lachnospiraceae bacterium]
MKFLFRLKKNEVNIKSILAIVTMLTLCVGMMASYAVAGEGFSKYSKKIVNIGVVNYESAFFSETETGYYGYVPEFLQKIAEKTGWEYNYVVDEWSVLLEKLEKHEIDLVLNASYVEERKERFIYSNDIVGYETSRIYVRSDDTRYYYDDFKSFNNMKIAYLKNSIGEYVLNELASDNGFNYSPVIFTSIFEAYNELRAGNVDAVFSTEMGVRPYFKRVYEGNNEPLYAMTYKGNEELMQAFNSALFDILMVNPYFRAELDSKFFGKKLQGAVPNFTRKEAEFIKQNPVIYVQQYNNGMPYYTVKDDEEKGIQVDILNMISELTGLTFKNADENHKADFISGMILLENESVMPGYYLSEPVMSTTAFLVKRRNSNIPLDGKVVIGIVSPSNSIEANLTNEFKHSSLVYFKSMDKCMESLIHGKISHAYIDYRVASVLIGSKYPSVEFVNAYIGTGDMFFAFEKNADNSVLSSILNKCIVTFSDETLIETTTIYQLSAASKADFATFLRKYSMQLLIIAVFFMAILYLFYLYLTNKRYLAKQLSMKNEELITANEKLRFAVAAKTDFMSNMSHEIRTPMNAIIGMTKIAQSEIEENKTLDRASIMSNLNDIETSSSYLLSLINDILDMSRIESGKLELNRDWIRTPELLSTVEKIIAPQMAEKKIDFSIEYVKDQNKHVEVFADATRCRQVLMNLLSNAYKFTGEYGKVSLKIERNFISDTNCRDKITIKDNGCGMSRSFLQKIYEPFAQERNMFSDKYSGTGLGLALVNRIVTEMSGTIEVTSELEVGTTFTIILPFEYRPAVSDKKEENVELGPKIDSILYGKSILLAEDQELNRRIAAKLLESKHMKVTYAINGLEAYRLFNESQDGAFDMILMDIRMPVMNGIEATRKIRESYNSDAATIPIIAMTANAFAEDVKECLNAGMNAHLSKPIYPDSLFKTMAKFFIEM